MGLIETGRAKFWVLLAVAAAFLAPLLLPLEALAGTFELSAGGAFTRSNYGVESYNWNRRWTASFGYHFSDRSEIEVSFQDVVDRTHIAGYEDTTFHDQIYSFSWVQSLLGKDYIIDPYFKVGIGQLNRDASGSYGGVDSPSTQVDAVTGILGGGVRINITKHFGLRAEVDTYLTGGKIGTWQDNISANAGFSFYF
jgi:hypothetical protein